MKLELFRTYLPGGTNGVLSYNKIRICATIELPYKNNAHRISCIPEGEYELVKRWSPKFKDHLWLQDVPERDLILIHPANNAIKELQGCIAPVSFITGEGKGALSKPALKKLLKLIADNSQQDKVTLSISKGEVMGSIFQLHKKRIMKKVVTRMQRKTPAFFKKLRIIGIGLAAVATTIVAGPVALPAIVIKIAGYLAVAGGVITAVSQTAVKNDE